MSPHSFCSLFTCCQEMRAAASWGPESSSSSGGGAGSGNGWRWWAVTACVAPVRSSQFRRLGNIALPHLVTEMELSSSCFFFYFHCSVVASWLQTHEKLHEILCNCLICPLFTLRFEYYVPNCRFCRRKISFCWCQSKMLCSICVSHA